MNDTYLNKPKQTIAEQTIKKEKLEQMKRELEQVDLEFQLYLERKEQQWDDNAYYNF